MTSREERLEHRLRGAQRRQVKDVDFALVIPSIPSPAPPNVPSDQQDAPAELPAVPSERRTPTTRGRAQATPIQEPATQLVARSSNFDANISAKRRKLDTDVAPSSSRSTRSSRSAPRPDVYNLPEEEQNEPDPNISTVSIEQESIVSASAPELALQAESDLSNPQRRSLRTPSIPPPAAEEVTESPADAPGSGHRSRLDLVATASASSQLQNLENSGLFETAAIETPLLKKRKRASAAPASAAVSVRRRARAEEDPSLDDLDELSPEQPKKRGRKPKVTVIQNPRIDSEPVPRSPEQEEAEEVDDLQAAAILKNTGRRKSRNLPPQPSPDLDEAANESEGPISFKRRKTRNLSSPAKQSHPKKPSSQSTQGIEKASKKARLSNGPPIPVTVYRLTNQPQYDEHESDAEILNAEIPHAKRGGASTIDVLRDLCQEVVQSSLESLEEGGSNAENASTKREYKLKWQAVKSYGQELHVQLVDHATNIDNAYSFEKRVREEQKRKLNLRNEILRTRAERQQLALQMDEIRIKHENESTVAQNRDALSIAIHDIELAVQRGKASDPILDSSGATEKIGLEVMLGRVAEQVSGSTGILKRIKDFNAFLERAAFALETTRI